MTLKTEERGPNIFRRVTGTGIRAHSSHLSKIVFIEYRFGNILEEVIKTFFVSLDISLTQRVNVHKEGIIVKTGHVVPSLTQGC